MRLVLDANVLVSAILWPVSHSSKVYDIAVQHTILKSQLTIDELEDVLGRSKFDRYAAREKRLAFHEQVSILSEMVVPDNVIQACRDPKDDRYLELALSGKAEVNVTGDADLLALHPFHGIAILSPADFVGRAGALGSPTEPG